MSHQTAFLPDTSIRTTRVSFVKTTNKQEFRNIRNREKEIPREPLYPPMIQR